MLFGQRVEVSAGSGCGNVEIINEVFDRHSPGFAEEIEDCFESLFAIH